MLEVVHYPHPALTKKCKPVTVFDDELRVLVEQMYLTMNIGNGIGLAANQVNVDKYFFVMEISNVRYCFINPVILNKTGSTIYKEGCLSFPGISQNIERFERISLKWQDVYGQSHEQEFNGLAAICIQHEIEHIEGKIFLDNLSSLKKQIALKKYHKTSKK